MIQDRDNGYRELVKRILASKGVIMTVGIHAEEGGAPDGALTVVEVAEVNEYGLGPPARPFLGPWADSNADTMPRRMREEYEAALKAGADPIMRLDALAQVAAGEVQAKISGGIAPPNAPSTIARKGSSTPLIDTNQLRSSIRGKVGPK